MNGAAALAKDAVDEVADVHEETTDAPELPRQKRKTIKGFMDSFKNNLIEMFKEEEDAQL